MPITPPPQSEVEKSLTIPPPVSGWNTKDPKSDMNPLFAPELENFFAAFGAVSLRSGYRYYSKSIGTDLVLALGVLEYGTISKLVAYGASTHKMYDASAATSAATDISGGVGFANDIVFIKQFNDRIFIKALTASNHLYSWTGTGNIVASGFTGPAGDDKDLGVIGVFKGRPYFAQISVPSIWYPEQVLPPAITGALKEFPLASIFQNGIRAIYFCGGVTRAKEYAEDELFCAISDQGEVLIYEGDYPGSITWNLLGRYTIPKPVSYKACFYIGSSLHVMTRSGLVSIQDVMRQNSQTGVTPTRSENIDPEFSNVFTPDVNQSIVSTGISCPSAQYVLLNVPIISGFTITSIQQWVMNLTTGAWAKFTGQTAYCWAYYNDQPYFGGSNGKVFKANQGDFDEDPVVEGAVLTRNIKVRHAFNYFNDPEKRKKFVAAIPTVYQSEGLSITANIDVDYSDVPAISLEEDVDKGTAFQLYQPRLGLVAPSGNAGSFRIDGTVTTKKFRLEATKVYWNEGTDY